MIHTFRTSHTKISILCLDTPPVTETPKLPRLLSFFFCSPLLSPPLAPRPRPFCQKISRLADRHLVVLVGDQEVCRGGVPAPSPPTEGSRWAYDLSSTEKAAAACFSGGDGGGRADCGAVEVCSCVCAMFCCRGMSVCAVICCPGMLVCAMIQIPGVSVVCIADDTWLGLCVITD